MRKKKGSIVVVELISRREMNFGSDRMRVSENKEKTAKPHNMF